MDNKQTILNYIQQVGLSQKMKDRKIKIEDIMHYVYEEARKHKDGDCAMIEDKVVFGWVVHYIEDGYKEKLKSKSKKDDDEEIEETENEEKSEEKAEEKHFEQLSLFDSIQEEAKKVEPSEQK